jgi:DNA-directed RNA polymerase specialized sigma24 family protein
MSSSTVDQVLEFVPDGQRFVRGWFGMDEGTAADVVQDVLHRLLREGPDLLEHPKRYFLRACRWRALQVLRERKRRRAYEGQRVRQQAKEVLVALEDEDKPKFFGEATPKQPKVPELLIEGRCPEELSATLEISNSTVQVRLHLTRRRNAG